MKNIYEILAGIGLEVPEEKKGDFDKEWKENYRTKAEYDKAVEARDKYKTSLEDVQGKLNEFKDVDVEDLKEQISTLTTQLQEEKDARAADARKVELEKNVSDFLGSKKFVNALTEKSIRQSLMDELDKDTAKGRSIEDIFTALITDDEGKQMENILVDEQKQQAQQKAARFTTAGTGKKTDPGEHISMSELMKMKNENPGLDISQYIKK